MYAVKRNGEWHVDLVAMLRRHDLDLMADYLENQEKRLTIFDEPTE